MTGGYGRKRRRPNRQERHILFYLSFQPYDVYRYEWIPPHRTCFDGVTVVSVCFCTAWTLSILYEEMLHSSHTRVWNSRRRNFHAYMPWLSKHFKMHSKWSSTRNKKVIRCLKNVHKKVRTVLYFLNRVLVWMPIGENIVAYGISKFIKGQSPSYRLSTLH